MKAHILTILSLLLIICGCTKKVDTIVGTGDKSGDKNVLLSSSFEADGIASWDGWVNPGPPVVKFANEAPAVGGQFSIFLKAKDAGAIVYKTIEPRTGAHKYLLSFWAKATEDSGTLDIYLKKGSAKVNSKTEVIRSKDWHQYSIETEFTAVQGDSIEIYLSGSEYVVPQGFTYFDNVVLKLIE